ncbi:MAG: C25 family cysteine peptidase, partial [Chitinophagales bacterium]
MSIFQSVKIYFYTNFVFLFASNYEIGEGWGTTAFSTQILNSSNFVNDPNIPAKLRLHIAGRNEIQHKLEYRINNSKIGEGQFLGSSMYRTEMSFPSSLITSNSTTIGITPLVASNHGYNLGFLELTYPSNFNMNGTGFNYMYFTNNIGSRKFEISGYNSTNTALLYDQTRNTRVVHQAGNTHRFVIPPLSSSDPFVLAHEGIVTSLTSVQKLNLSPIAARGNFIIIADRNVSLDSNGVNVINDYKTYKESPEGGGFKVAVVYMDEIQNHFGYGMPRHPIGIRKFLQWAKLTWGADAPIYALLLGKGFTANIMGTANQTLYNQNIIPSFGHIGSDYMYTTMDTSILQYMPLGRISATNGQIIRNYLNKLKSYNAEYNATSPSDMTPAKKE